MHGRSGPVRLFLKKRYDKSLIYRVALPPLGEFLLAPGSRLALRGFRFRVEEEKIGLRKTAILSFPIRPQGFLCYSSGCFFFPPFPWFGLSDFPRAMQSTVSRPSLEKVTSLDWLLYIFENAHPLITTLSSISFSTFHSEAC